MPRTFLTPAAVLLVLSSGLLFAYGCGGDAAAPPRGPGDDVRDATLAVGSATSLGRVGVNGLPAPQSGAKAVEYRAVLSAAGAQDLPLALDHDDQGWFFPAPLHPIDPNGGGAFQVRITDGNAESGSHDLAVTGLPPAPGAFASLVATLREHLEQRAVWAGTSLAALQATPAAEVDAGLLPLKLAQSYLDSEADSRDLTDLVADTDGFLGGEHAELLDRVFGYFAVETLLRQEIDGFAGGEGTLRFMGTRPGGDKACIDAGPEISSAPGLAMAMTRSAVAQFGADPDSDAGRILANGGTALGVLGVVPGFGAPAGVAGAVLGTVQAATQFVGGLLPSYFVSLECHVDKTEFNEDATDFATYSNVKVVAASTGWSADRSIATVAINLLGSYLSATEQARILGSDVLRDIAVLGLGTAAGEVFEDTDLIEFCPQQWTIDISSPLYCTAAALARRFDVDIPAQKVTPAEVGADHLRVAAQAAQFGGRQVHLDIPMQVKQIQVVVLPDDLTVENPGENIEITAEIHNADLTTLNWTPDQGNWEDGLGDDTNDGRTRTLRTPTSADAYPFLVRIESLSRNGLRSSGLPTRIGYATIRLDRPLLRIEPRYACIQPGETQQFTAAVTGIEPYTVVWSVVEGYGSINQDGLYQSLSQGTSNAVIEAKLQEDEAVADQANVDAAACNCLLDVTITGDANWQSLSAQAAYMTVQFDDLFYQFFFDLGSEGPPGIGASIGGGLDEKPSPQPGDTGTWKAAFTFFTESESWFGLWDDDAIPLPGVSVNITSLTESSMEGSFTGNAFQLDENGEVTSIIGVDVQFKAGLWDGGGWPCN